MLKVELYTSKKSFGNKFSKEIKEGEFDKMMRLLSEDLRMQQSNVDDFQPNCL